MYKPETGSITYTEAQVGAYRIDAAGFAACIAAMDIDVAKRQCTKHEDDTDSVTVTTVSSVEQHAFHLFARNMNIMD